MSALGPKQASLLLRAAAEAKKDEINQNALISFEYAQSVLHKLPIDILDLVTVEEDIYASPLESSCAGPDAALVAARPRNWASNPGRNRRRFHSVELQPVQERPGCARCWLRH